MYAAFLLKILIFDQAHRACTNLEVIHLELIVLFDTSIEDKRQLALDTTKWMEACVFGFCGHLQETEPV